MKTVNQLFSLVILILIIGLAGTVHAQGRGHQKGHDKYESKKNDHDCTHPHDRKHRKGHRHQHTRVERHHHHSPVVAHRHHARPRYIYYRDYNVYYDLRKNVYVSYAGRNWSVSASLPVVLRRADLRRAVRMEVDYYQDDLPVYLAHAKPSYRRLYTEF